MPSVTKPPVSASLVLALLHSAPAWAADIDLSLPIDAVTVYLSGAEVTRRGTSNLPAGEHRLIISNLPPGIDPARLNLQILDTSVRLGSLQLEEIHTGDLVSEAELALQAELDDLLDRQMAINDEIAAANTQLKLLESLAAGGGGSAEVPSGSELTALLQTLSTASGAARAVIRASNQQLRVLEREIEQKRFELSQVATRQRSQNAVTVSISVGNAVNTAVSLSYPVTNAGWNWLYEARLDTDSRRLELQRKVSVAQVTGEDWNNVAMTITTARPSANTQTPQLGSLLVDFRPPQTLMRLEARNAAAEQAVQSLAVPDFDQRFMDVTASPYLVEFAIPGRVSLVANSQPQLFPADQRAVDVDLVVRTVPERDQNAYLEARFILEDSLPLQEGVMQFYRDGAFIGRRGVPEFLPRQSVSLPFGKDERVRVENFPEQEQSRSGGTLRRSALDDRRVRYVITSFHPEPIALEVLGRIPISQNNAIEVEVSRDATSADETAVDGNPGVLLWRRTTQPQEKVEIRHFYSISYPQDNQLWFQEN
jgi:uncharacterized protein (TIGR02231 family)